MRAVGLALVWVPLAGAALASPCGERIARLQHRYDAAPILSGAPPIGTSGGAVESAGALLHRQPTAAVAPDARGPALSPQDVRNARFRDYMDDATAANDSNDAATCEAAVAKAEAVYKGH